MADDVKLRLSKKLLLYDKPNMVTYYGLAVGSNICGRRLQRLCRRTPLHPHLASSPLENRNILDTHIFGYN